MYRKKPVVIEARQLLDDDNVRATAKWCKGFVAEVETVISIRLVGIEIKTLEGTMLAEVNDFIIKGIRGEFYPCKPDIFEATYEKVEE